jgi:hypothetical protein
MAYAIQGKRKAVKLLRTVKRYYIFLLILMPANQTQSGDIENPTIYKAVITSMIWKLHCRLQSFSLRIEKNACFWII